MSAIDGGRAGERRRATVETPRLLAVHAHPDDETLATGALLAAWAAAGLPTAVVTCTRGERGEVIGERYAALEGDGPALAAHRETELAAALAALGVEEHHFLDRLPGPAARYEDSGMAWVGDGTAGAAACVPHDALVRVPLEQTAGRLAGLLQRERPDVVATYDPEGGYGHPDHVRAHQLAMRAIALVPDYAPVVLWRSTTPSRLRADRRALARATWLAPRAARLALPDPEGDLPPIASDERAVAIAVAVSGVLDRVLGAMRAHATQIQDVQAAPADAPIAACYALSNDVLAAVGLDETYCAAPGSSTLDGVRWPHGVRRVA